MQIGDVVKLKSGGMSMTVIDVEEDINIAKCCLTDGNGRFIEVNIPTICLKGVDSAEEK